MSNAVIRQPHNSGRPNSSLSAMIVPRISARSVAAIATSASTQSTALTLGEYSARQAWARSCPVTTPSRAARVCSRIGHQVRHQQDPDQRIAEPGTSLQVRRPVPRVHVADADQIGRPQECQELPQTRFLPVR